MSPTTAPGTAAPNHATGPRTPEGKATSALNSLKHGLTAEAALIPGENPAEFKAFTAGFLKALNPGSEAELHLARAVAADNWRIDRIRRLEQVHIAAAIENLIEPDPKRLNLYSLYESRLNRNIKNNMAEFRQLQITRLEAELLALESLAARSPHHHSSHPGFVSSPSSKPAAHASVPANPHPTHPQKPAESSPQSRSKAA